jgi:hypothetical protein
MSRGSELVYVVSGSCQGESELEREMTRHTPQQPRDLPSLSVFQTAPRRTRGIYRIILYRSCYEQQIPQDDNNRPLASSTLMLPGILQPMFWWHHEKLQRKSQRRAALHRNRVEERDIAQQQRLITWFGAILRSLCQHERAIENLVQSIEEVCGYQTAVLGVAQIRKAYRTLSDSRNTGRKPKAGTVVYHSRKIVQGPAVTRTPLKVKTPVNGIANRVESAGLDVIAFDQKVVTGSTASAAQGLRSLEVGDIDWNLKVMLHPRNHCGEIEYPCRGQRYGAI